MKLVNVSELSRIARTRRVRLTHGAKEALCVTLQNVVEQVFDLLSINRGVKSISVKMWVLRKSMEIVAEEQLRSIYCRAVKDALNGIVSDRSIKNGKIDALKVKQTLERVLRDLE